MGNDIILFYDAFDAYMKEDYNTAFEKLEDMRFIALQELHNLEKGSDTWEEIQEYIRLVEVLMAKISIKFESHDPKGLNEA